MDNQLTPNKIQRLIYLAEDRSFNMPRRMLINDEDLKRLATTNQATINRSNATVNCESSSGILDLDKMEGFGESGIGELSLSKSTNFNPGEMTGRSTGTEDMNMPLGRHSIALENITSQMDKQTSEIQDIMRHSIATNYSFHSKRDLTADEISLVAREAPLPIQNNTQTHFTDSMSMNNSNISVGAYFKNRCPDFGQMLGKMDSPDRSYMPSITEVSGTRSDAHESLHSEKQSVHKMDQTLDCVPVRQPRNNMDNIQEKPTNVGQVYAPQSNFMVPKIENLNEASNTNLPKVPEKSDHFYMSQVPDKPKYIQMPVNSVSPQKNTPVPVNRETNFLIKNLQASLRLMGEDTEGSVENSFSISKIADYLGKQSNVSVTDMLQYNNQKKQLNKKQPLTELHLNIQESKKINKDIEVTSLRDTHKTDAASSSGTVNTVISLNKYKANNELGVPTVFVTEHSLKEDQIEVEETKRTTRSKSPSSKSHSTLTTVQENCSSFKSGDSLLHHSKGEANTSHVRSPNVVYKELDKSVDWHEVLQQKRPKQDSLAKEQWVEISAPTVNGYVGACCPVVLTVTTLTDSWLTSKLQFEDLPHEGSDITVELPRMPLLLSPGKTEKITMYITSNIEFNTKLNFTMHLKDTAVDGDIKQKGNVEVNIKMPVIQAMSSDGVNKVTFPAIQENTSLTKSFVLISSCPADLQLILSVVEGESIFTIKNVQEIKKSDVNKVLMDWQGSSEDGQYGKAKSKTVNKQLCRLSAGNAIRVTIKFHAPKVSMPIVESLLSCTGMLNVNLIGVNSVIRKVDLIGAVGTVKLVLKTTANKLQLTNDPTNVDLCNNGSIAGNWIVKFKTNSPIDTFPFKIVPSKFEIQPGATQTVSMAYTGHRDTTCDALLTFEEIATGHKTTVEISGGIEKPKTFPIKTNYNNISWVRPGRKELSLKNATNKKIYIRCQIVGDGFAIDLPRESRGVYCVTFGPCECRPLPIIFAPNCNTPQKATLHLVYDKNSDYSRKICLYGCASGESMRWSGLVTYGDTALVRAVSRSPINLELYNKSSTAAFVSARVHFNLQYMCLSSNAEVVGGANVVRGRSRHVVSLRVAWPALERRARAAPSASALATLTILTGAEFTRRRILKILRDESNGNLDTALLPDHLKVLAEKFDGEDETMDHMIADFKETKASLNELIGGLQELTAQIDLPQDFADDNTILIDDTVVEHHTLCD